MPKTGPSLSREDAGERHASNAMIAHACAVGGATLASAYLPRRERGWGSAVRAPEPLKGPDPKHLLRDADGEGFGGTGAEVPPPARAPTMEYVRANFVIPRGPEEEEPPAAAGVTDGNADAGEGEEPAEPADGVSRPTDEGAGASGEGGEANAAKAGDAETEAAAAKKEDAKRSTRLPTTARTLAEARIEAEARAKREALAERTRLRADSFAAKIKHPKLKFEL
jgi:hypothetical protein